MLDVNAEEMAKDISRALWKGRPDASNGLLYNRVGFGLKNLMLWSGASPQSRKFWCNSLGLYMLLGMAFVTFG